MESDHAIKWQNVTSLRQSGLKAAVHHLQPAHWQAMDFPDNQMDTVPF